MSLVCDVIANRKIASLSLRLRATEGPLFSHSASVAYLSVLLGLELENYIILERTRLNAKDARDFTGLGLAGMLHDIGKTVAGPAIAEVHEASAKGGPVVVNGDGTIGDAGFADAYLDHPRVGYDMLEASRLPPATRQAVLMHHQRFDGGGWQGRTRPSDREPVSGTGIHVFSRIVAVANVLDSLMTKLGPAAPPALALHEFASSGFDGWFDPVVRRAALRAVPPFTIGSRVTLTDGTVAVVTTPNRDVPLLPVVRPLVKDGESHMIDLANDATRRKIERVGKVGVGQVSYEVPAANMVHAA